ncbi:MAG: aminomethyltransferase [Actinomycetota bacterium]|nr:aminomethyltransferase [Actinomycetota bacterium]
MAQGSGTTKSTVLLDRHRELGAKLTNFGGWEMPLQYSGIVAEHNAVRNSTGVFDVSHLGKLSVSGPGSTDALERALTANIGALEAGAATYALVLNEDGGAIDDVFAYRIADEDWLVVPNASNVEAVAAAIRDQGAEPVDVWDRWTILALQGPDAFDVFNSIAPGSPALELPLHRWMTVDLLGEPTIVARTGYTGERGFELYVPTSVSEKVFDMLLDSGTAPVGLGARDTLRLEMGYALYGHELTEDINPLEASLGWTLAWDTPFRGREALAKIKEAGPARRLFALRATDRGVPRQDYPVFVGDAEIARLTSGNFSPTLGTGIGLALGPAEAKPEIGSTVEIEARGRRIPAVIVKPPFIEHGPKKS